MKKLQMTTWFVLFGLLASACGGAGEEKPAAECYDDGGYCIDASLTGNFQVTGYTGIEGAEEMPSYEFKDEDQIDVQCQSGDNTQDGILEVLCLATGEYVDLTCSAGKIAYLDADGVSYSSGCAHVTYYCTSDQGFMIDSCAD